MKLENWCVVLIGGLYDPPECYSQRLRGVVFGHPRHTDGTEIATSSIVGLKDGLVLTESGSSYELGEIDPEYEAAFPDARNRLLDSLTPKEG